MAGSPRAGAGERLLRYLANGPAHLAPASATEVTLVEAVGRGTIAVANSDLASVAKTKLVTRVDGIIALTELGKAAASRLLAGSDRYQEQHRDIEMMPVEVQGQVSSVAVNRAESPLAQLMRRSTKSDASYLAQFEYDAGERLRSDYTRGQIMPRLGANWVASVSSGRRGGAGGAAELTEAALAARQRVERALEAVGPELAGVLVDICCFLKGMELVERERGWPVRSAKLMLKTGLSALARHYRMRAPHAAGARPPVLHWGAEDYRPTIAG